MRTLLRATITATFLYGAVALVALALSEPAYPQASKGDRLEAPEHAAIPPASAIPKDEARPFCGMYFDTLVGLPGWRILKGDRLQAYLETLFTNVPNGDALAYAVNGDRVALVLGRDGCVVARQIIPENVHRAVVLKALGMVV